MCNWILQSGKEKGNGKDIGRNNRQIYSKFSKKYKGMNLRCSTNLKYKKHEVNYQQGIWLPVCLKPVIKKIS